MSIITNNFSYQVELVFTPQTGEKQRMEIYDFKGPGVSIGMFNTDDSIKSFAHSSMQVCIQYIHIVCIYETTKIDNNLREMAHFL